VRLLQVTLDPQLTSTVCVLDLRFLGALAVRESFIYIATGQEACSSHDLVWRQAACAAVCSDLGEREADASYCACRNSRQRSHDTALQVTAQAHDLVRSYRSGYFLLRLQDQGAHVSSSQSCCIVKH